ncbi:MAG TPA: hypothetical protein VE029_09275 [Rhizobacter sp.]|nr:hypothetical protein [Rhizobacter sp.]
MNGYKSKTLATWFALVGGSLGWHRLYLYGVRDAWAWLWPLPTLLGAYGVERVWTLGQDDHLAWLLVPLLGMAVAAAMLTAIVYGLMPDEKWNARFNPNGPEHHTGWLAIGGVVLALLVGATVLMSTIAFSSQRFFEYEIDEAHKISR